MPDCTHYSLDTHRWWWKRRCRTPACSSLPELSAHCAGFPGDRGLSGNVPIAAFLFDFLTETLFPCLWGKFEQWDISTHCAFIQSLSLLTFSPPYVSGGNAKYRLPTTSQKPITNQDRDKGWLHTQIIEVNKPSTTSRHMWNSYLPAAVSPYVESCGAGLGDAWECCLLSLNDLKTYKPNHPILWNPPLGLINMSLVGWEVNTDWRHAYLLSHTHTHSHNNCHFLLLCTSYVWVWGG